MAGRNTTAKYLDRFARTADPKRRTFVAMLSAMDDAVDRVLATVREQGQEENTLIFFIADNAGPTHGTTSQNGTLRGFKMNTYGGGPRVPFVVHWKGRLPAGRTYDLPVMNLDVLPPIMAAAGKPVDPAAAIDGIDLMPFLAGTAAGRPHETMFWRFGPQWAVRGGDWKLVVSKGGGDKPELYKIAADIGENNDLAASEAARVAELQKLYDGWNAQQAEPTARDADKAMKKQRTAARRGKDRRPNRTAA